MNAQDMSDISGMLRQMMIHMDPIEYELNPIGEDNSVYGSVIDISEANENYTSLIILSDGSASMLMSNGRGMIQNVQSKEVKDLSIKFLNGLANLIELAKPINEITPPLSGQVQVFVVTTSGVKVYAEEKTKLMESSLGANFNNINELVGELAKQ